jgi:hypothetical protein
MIDARAGDVRDSSELSATHVVGLTLLEECGHSLFVVRGLKEFPERRGDPAPEIVEVRIEHPPQTLLQPLYG